MKAAYIDTTVAPDVIRYGDLPDPEPKEGEVRVRVAAVAVNPIDTYIRGDSVSRFKVGDRVWGSNQGLLGRQGTFAELCCAHEDFLYPTPTGVKDEDVAAIALVGITAHLGLFLCAKLKAGEMAFVNGGTGGVVRYPPLTLP